MDNSNWVVQNPAPGTHLLMFRGDTRTFTLTLSHAEKGSAWLRTNIGHARIVRAEIFGDVRRNEPPLARDWFDIPMKRSGNRRFQVTVPLCEVGHFEAKCFFLKKGESTPVWPPGSNCVINVEPADTSAILSIMTLCVCSDRTRPVAAILMTLSHDACEPLIMPLMR